MQIIVTSRGMKANDILDMAYDMGFERPHIVTAGEWDGGRVHILTYGKAAYRKTLEIAAPIQPDAARRLLEQALGQPTVPLPNAPTVEIIGTEIIRRPGPALSPDAQDAIVRPSKPKRKVSKVAH